MLQVSMQTNTHIMFLPDFSNNVRRSYLLTEMETSAIDELYGDLAQEHHGKITCTVHHVYIDVQIVRGIYTYMMCVYNVRLAVLCSGSSVNMNS